MMIIMGPLQGEYDHSGPHRGPVMLSFDVLFVVSLNKLLGKQ